MKPTRRTFLKATAVAAASPLFFPKLVRAGSLDKVNVAVIGVLGQGWWNLGQLRNDANIVALCDVDRYRMAKAARGFPQAVTYADYRVMLEKQKDIDAVLVATPDHTHAPAACMAMRMGKHCYCEKPLAHSVYETRTMAELAAEKGLATQMGIQIHAGANYRRVVELIRGGAIGPVREAYVWCGKSWSNGRFKHGKQTPKNLDWNLWLGPARLQPYSDGVHPSQWRRFWEFGTGTLGDMACHYMDLVHWALDLRAPTSVQALGPAVHEVGTPETLVVHYEHPAAGDRPAVRVSWYDGSARPSILSALRTKDGQPLGWGPDGQRRAWGDGQLFVGDEGMIISNYSNYILLPEEKFEGFEPPEPTIPDSIGHHREWLEGITNGSPTTCNFDYSAALSETVLLGNIAFRVGKKLEWDTESMKATNAPEADVLVRPELRDGWGLG
jgi:predicted dehydrogenase